MILYRWQGHAANFGDELNTVLWPRLLPDMFDQDPAERFLGIGSVLDDRHPRHVRKLVAGAGYAGYEARPVLDQSWIVHWVRGPRTATALGLPRGLALGDPAILLRHALDLPQRDRREAIGFMPHFESADRGQWEMAARMAGLRLIDPRGSPLDVLKDISRCKLLVSEALHGVIAADTLRVPWVAIRPRAAMHRAKWQDWAEGMHITLRQTTLPASTALEWIAARPCARSHTARTWLASHRVALHRFAAASMLDRAAVALAAAARLEPQISAAKVLDCRQSAMLDALEVLRHSPYGSAPIRQMSLPRHSCLQRHHVSAYQTNPIR